MLTRIIILIAIICSYSNIVANATEIPTDQQITGQTEATQQSKINNSQDNNYIQVKFINPQEESYLDKKRAIETTPKDKIENKVNNFEENNQKTLPHTVNNTIKKSYSKFSITINGKTYNISKYINTSVLLTILGLSGTFFGLFSTWLIYHLNRKRNNPLVIDKNNTTIEYIDKLNRLKICYSGKNLQKLYMTLSSLNTYPEHDIEFLLDSFQNTCKNISCVDLIDIHTRYKKHISKYKNDIFDSLITSYKIIKIDGDYLTNCEYGHKMFNRGTLVIDNNTERLKSKLTSMITFEEQIDVILELLQKDLK